MYKKDYRFPGFTRKMFDQKNILGLGLRLQDFAEFTREDCWFLGFTWNISGFSGLQLGLQVYLVYTEDCKFPDLTGMNI